LGFRYQYAATAPKEAGPEEFALSTSGYAYSFCDLQSVLRDGSLYDASDSFIHLDGVFAQVLIQHGVEYGSASVY